MSFVTASEADRESLAFPVSPSKETSFQSVRSGLNSPPAVSLHREENGFSQTGIPEATATVHEPVVGRLEDHDFPQKSTTALDDEAAAEALMHRLQLSDAVDSSSDVLMESHGELPLQSRALRQEQPAQLQQAQVEQLPLPAMSLPDRTATSLSNALRDVVHERELALEMRPFLQQIVDNAGQSGMPAQDTLAWQLAGHADLQEALHLRFAQPQFGEVEDATCSWFHAWTSAANPPALQRFAASQGPTLAVQYLLTGPSITASGAGYQGDANAGLEACLVAWHEALSVDAAAGSAHLVAIPAAGKPGGPYTLPDLRQECRLPAAVSEAESLEQQGTSSWGRDRPVWGAATILASPLTGVTLGNQIQGVRAWQRDGVAAAALAAFACWAPTFPDALLLGFARLAALLALAGCTSFAGQAAQTLQAHDFDVDHGLGDAAAALTEPDSESAPQARISVAEGPLLRPLCQTLGAILLRCNASPLHQTLRNAALGAISVLHIRACHSLSAEALVYTQSLLATAASQQKGGFPAAPLGVIPSLD
ncbi:hypothetical protein WJX84_006391 [Apatococcus fuscideae]|uniref:Uncharacterized protein n=1 Tax=Apatococcus fuscideae TaxID=2026836 RepID=A0AAW1TDC3_9CHLO